MRQDPFSTQSSLQEVSQLKNYHRSTLPENTVLSSTANVENLGVKIGETWQINSVVTHYQRSAQRSPLLSWVNRCNEVEHRKPK